MNPGIEKLINANKISKAEADALNPSELKTLENATVQLFFAQGLIKFSDIKAKSDSHLAAIEQSVYQVNQLLIDLGKFVGENKFPEEEIAVLPTLIAREIEVLGNPSVRALIAKGMIKFSDLRGCRPSYLDLLENPSIQKLFANGTIRFASWTSAKSASNNNISTDDKTLSQSSMFYHAPSVPEQSVLKPACVAPSLIRQ